MLYLGDSKLVIEGRVVHIQLQVDVLQLLAAEMQNGGSDHWPKEGLTVEASCPVHNARSGKSPRGQRMRVGLGSGSQSPPTVPPAGPQASKEAAGRLGWPSPLCPMGHTGHTAKQPLLHMGSSVYPQMTAGADKQGKVYVKPLGSIPTRTAGGLGTGRVRAPQWGWEK